MNTEPMNIWALSGHRVMVTELSYSRGEEEGEAPNKRLLKIGETYTVDRTIVHYWHTEVFLREIPDQSFNAAWFVDVDNQTTQRDREHPPVYISYMGHRKEAVL